MRQHAACNFAYDAAASRRITPCDLMLAPTCCRLARDSHGYTGADLEALCREAAMCAISAAVACAAQSSTAQRPSLGASATGAAAIEAATAVAARSQNVVQPGRQQEQQVPLPHTSGQAIAAVAAVPPLLQPITASDFFAAMKRVGPSMARGSAVEYEAIRCAWCLP